MIYFCGGTKQSTEILEERLSESSGSSSGVLSSGEILQIVTEYWRTVSQYSRYYGVEYWQSGVE